MDEKGCWIHLEIDASLAKRDSGDQILASRRQFRQSKHQHCHQPCRVHRCIPGAIGDIVSNWLVNDNSWLSNTLSTSRVPSRKKRDFIFSMEQVIYLKHLK
jgi:hypothetical protein